MAVIGEKLVSPENGWSTYNYNDSNISYVGATWTVTSGINPRDSSNNIMNTYAMGDYLSFKFTGTGIRVLAYVSTNRSSNVEIDIDGNIEYFSTYSATTNGGVLVYENLNLSKGEHTVKITLKENLFLSICAIDFLIKKKVILKNQKTNQHYSLADKTLILLPNDSEDSIIEYGIEAGKEIQLDEPFDKKIFISDTVTVNDKGKKITIHLSPSSFKTIKNIL